MRFLKSLFSQKKTTRESLRRFVELEYKPSEREAQYQRMLKESNLY